jgi:galactonate dehydratase
MKVTGIETILLDNVPSDLGGRKWLFLKLATDEGIVGLGERVSGGVSDLRAQVALLEHVTEQFVIGENPFQVERIWQRMFAALHDYRHPGMDRTPALSAIEMSLWDIIGTATNQPIYNLLGGRYHEKLRAYAYTPATSLGDFSTRGLPPARSTHSYWDFRCRGISRSGT